jgi:multidrug efflux pump subunit AcrB
MTLVAIMILGVAAIRLLPVSLVPDIDVPHITVQVTSPDKSARELNETMVAPLHSQLVQIPNLENITSTAKDGSGIIELTFKYGADADYIFIDVNERVDRAMASWPQGEERPLIARASATDIPAFFVNITLKEESKNRNFLEMSDFVRQVIVRRFEQLSEIAMVDVSGQMFSQLLVIPDMEKLRSLGIDENTLTSAIQNSNIRLGSLSIRDGEYRFDVRFESAILSKQDVEDVYLKINDRVFQIKDLAKVREEPQVMKGMTTSDGKQAVTLAVIKRSDARMAERKHNVDRLMKS